MECCWLQLIELSPHDRLIIDAQALFTGIDLRFKKDVSIHIWDGKVQLIKKRAKNHKAHQREAAGDRKNCRIISSHSLTVIPGLIDCHVHLAFDGMSGQHPHEEAFSLAERLQGNLSSNLACGIVAVRDGGDRGGAGLVCRDLVNAAELTGPVVMASGKALHNTGGYGSFLGAETAPEEFAKAIKRLAADNVDQVKALVSGIVSFKEYGRVGSVQFSLKELRRIVRIAADYGLKVMAHASSEQAVRLCIAAGVHSIEHGYFISESSLKAMADQGIAWAPTVVPVAVQSRSADPTEAAVIERTYRRQLRMIRLAQRLGVILGVGTDAGASGVRHGTGFWQELQLYREAGLTVEETLLAATKNGARIIGREESLGVIAPGRPAFLLIAEGDPLSPPGKQVRLKYLIRPRQRRAAAGSFRFRVNQSS